MPTLGEAKSHSFIGHNFGLNAPAGGDQAAVAHAAATWSEAQSRAVREAAARIAKLEDARASFREALAREINADAARQLREFSQHQRRALRSLLRAGDFQKRRETARTAREQSLRLMTEIGVNRERLRALYAEFKGEAAGIVQRPAVASRLLTRAPVEAAPQPIRDRVKSWDFKASPATADGLTIFQPPFDGWWWKGSWYPPVATTRRSTSIPILRRAPSGTAPSGETGMPVTSTRSRSITTRRYRSGTSRRRAGC